MHCIELPIFIIYFCFMISDYITTNFILYRTCYVLLGYNESDCALLGSKNATNETKILEAEVQPVASLIIMCRIILDSSLPVFCSFIVGPWSNKHGRKPILLSSFTGLLLTYVVIICICLIKSASPWWWLLTPICAALGGGLCSLLTVSFCYISDITTEANRGLRMGILELTFGLGTIMGTLLSSHVFDALGYVGVYSICATSSFIAVLYIKFFVSESLPDVNNQNICKDLFDFSLIPKAIRTCIKHRQNFDRFLLTLFISMLVSYTFVSNAEDSILFLYVRKRFNWPIPKYTLFAGINTIIDISATTFMLLIIHKLLGVKDTTIVLFGFCLLCTSSLIYGFSSEDWQVYMAAAVKRVNGIILPLVRSAISKIIPPEDLGSVFALTTSLGMVTQLASAPLYTLVYNKTLETLPSAYNFVSTGIYACNIVTTCVVIFIKKYKYDNYLKQI